MDKIDGWFPPACKIGQAFVPEPRPRLWAATGRYIATSQRRLNTQEMEDRNRPLIKTPTRGWLGHRLRTD